MWTLSQFFPKTIFWLYRGKGEGILFCNFREMTLLITLNGPAHAAILIFFLCSFTLAVQTPDAGYCI